jgi:2-polyprenyl-3-methyl-5-hydroxy-6-metoxy-1,4-benzoquinol methylase
MTIHKLGSSFRDPNGFIFNKDGEIYRQIHHSYKNNYDLLMQSGLYKILVESGDLISHSESDLPLEAGVYKIIKPELIPFISYPYEWCFSQLKAAALLTLKIQKKALDYRMSLKDANAFNIQFIGNKPILIDTLSFEKLDENRPWIAYKQFCEHFLAPLALSALTDDRLNKLSLININGISLDLAIKLLPFSARLKPGIFLHIFMHAKSQQAHGSSVLSSSNKKTFSINAFRGLLDSLESCIQGLSYKKSPTAWGDYYTENKCQSYNETALLSKKSLVSDFLETAKTKKLWDIGANAGLFSRLAAKKGIAVISMDFEPDVIEENYLINKQEGVNNILPLVIDLINPSPTIGWHNQERDSIFCRSLPDTVLALALVHHLAITNNVPLSMIAKLFADIGEKLIIEFVPKEDKQTQKLLQNREDIFDNYNEKEFEAEFSKFFTITMKKNIPDSKRSLYLMIRK